VQGFGVRDGDLGRAEVRRGARREGTDFQVAKILELCDHTAIEEKLAESIRARLAKGVTTARADQILVGLETQIKKETPAPTQASTPATPAAESAQIHQRTLRLNALLQSDRISPDVQNRVRERLAKSDLTLEVLEQAIAEMENVEIPF
jgi:hypothetical protein